MSYRGLRAWMAGVLTLLAVHAACVLWMPHPLKLSNLLQLMYPLLAAWFCFKERRLASTLYLRSLWLQVGGTFLLLVVAQAIYIGYILLNQPLPFPTVADYFWLFYSPLVIYICLSPNSSMREAWFGKLDFAQAAVSVVALCVLVALAPESRTFTLGYDLQTMAMLLAATLRFSIARNRPERTFFGRFAMYLVMYGLATVAGTYLKMNGSLPGSMVDLVWSLPIVFFFLSAGRASFRRRKSWLDSAPSHIQGIASLGLALLAMITAALLAVHRPALGLTSLGISFVLFMVRTLFREAELTKVQMQLKYAAEHDSLTGLANRNLLLQQIAKRLEMQHDSPEERMTLLFLDLDRFKVINDSLGHAFGDRLLVQVTERLRRVVREGEIISRLGGDEFVVLLQGASGTKAGEILAGRLLDELRLPFLLEDRVFHVTASIGMVQASQGDTPDALLRDADTAMYRAKNAGRDRLETFKPGMLSEANQELELESALRLALKEKSLEVWYQPICSLETGAVVGMEALARWRHPEGHFISPQQFIPLAEDTGLVVELGRQVLEQACFQACTWVTRFGSRIPLNVNVSGVQLRDPNFTKMIRTSLDVTGLDPSLLRLEVTESVLLKDPEQGKAVLAGLRELGIQICLDDFGTGYSSLAYLIDFPFDTLKIDQSFVRALEVDEMRRELVRTIVQLATNLRKQVIAEGIETQEERRWLQEIGCNLGQGYLLSRPLEADALTAILQTQRQNQRQTGQLVLTAA